MVIRRKAAILLARETYYKVANTPGPEGNFYDALQAAIDVLKARQEELNARTHPQTGNGPEDNRAGKASSKSGQTRLEQIPARETQKDPSTGS